VVGGGNQSLAPSKRKTGKEALVFFCWFFFFLFSLLSFARGGASPHRPSTRRYRHAVFAISSPHLRRCTTVHIGGERELSFGRRPSRARTTWTRTRCVIFIQKRRRRVPSSSYSSDLPRPRQAHLRRRVATSPGRPSLRRAPTSRDRGGAVYKLNPVEPQLASAWFQPLNL
jgi:hypothetical protein